MLDKSSSETRRAGASFHSQSKSLGKRLASVVIALIVLGLLFAGLAFWRGARVGGQQAWPQGPLPVAAMVVEPVAAPISLEAVGSLRAANAVMLAPEASGRVVEINFEAGEAVEDDALLVQLFDDPERADLAAAKAAVKLAETQFERVERLAPTGAASREALDQRRAERDQAEALVLQLEARIRQKQVRAPFAGEIGMRHINLGQYLNAGEPVATLTALDKLFVDFALPQQNLSRLRRGAAVEVTSDAWPERTFAAEVDAIEPQISADTRNVSVQAVLANEDSALRPGMYVTASLVLPPQEGALVVQATAIMTSAQGDSVVVVRGDNAQEGGTAEIVPVVSGRRIGNNVVVASGLAPGDVVVTEGQLRVQPGTALEVTSLLESQEK